MAAAAEGAKAQRERRGPGRRPAQREDDAEQGREDRENGKPGTAETGRAAAPRRRKTKSKTRARRRRDASAAAKSSNISRGRAAAALQPDDRRRRPAPAAAPSVRRIARELGVDIRQVTGTGPGGRITVDDVQGFVRQALAGGAASRVARRRRAPSQPLPDFTKWGDVERKPVSNIRRKTAEHLGHAWNVIPHVTQHDKADITALEALRKQYGPQAERAGGKLTVTAVALKILAGALRKFPAVRRVDRHWARAARSTRSTRIWASPSIPIAACSCPSSATSTRRGSSSSRRSWRRRRRRRVPASCRSTRCRAA